MSFLSGSTAVGSTSGSLFGAAPKPTSTTGGGLFGQPAATSAPATGGLFGQAATTSAPAAGGLFGQPATPQASAPGGLFGAAKPATAGAGMFGQQPAAAAPAGGLFGQKLGVSTAGTPLVQQPAASTTAGAGLFGQQPAATPAPAAGGSLFGSAAPRPGGLFGQQPAALTTAIPTATTTAARPTLFGALTTSAQPQATAAPASTTLGLSMANAQPTPAEQQPQAQQSGAYFDSLLAKSKKEGEDGETPMEDLPSLQLGLGDLRQRLRRLGPKQQVADGNAHYLLAASGVDPGLAARDLGNLDMQTGRVDRTSQAPTADLDVETYLANLQNKTTLSMIADGLERSVRDFDNFLEDNVTMEWEAQRKRIYQHFGIKPREESGSASTGPGREAAGGFGRSRRSKTQAPSSRAGRSSMMGKSNLQRSVIGTPSRIGAHQPEFADVDRPADSATPLGGGISSDDRLLREKQGKLAEKMRDLNAARLLGRPYPVLHEVAEVEKKSPDPHAPHIVEAYRAVMEVVGENPEAETTIRGATAKARQFAKRYLDDNPNSPNSVSMRRDILDGANRFLENQFLREVEALISKHPHEANLGGRPDIVSKIRAYIRLRSARKDLVPDNTDLQQVQGEYVWAIVFYLLRSGHVTEAAKYVNDNTNSFRSIDRTFSTYLNNYASSEDRRLKAGLQQRCNSEYIQRSRNAPENSIDPFRMACYKVIGRCELTNRSLEGLTTDINDWIWLQFNLAREGDRVQEMASESYGLAELQASVREIGLKHFPKTRADDNNGSFGMFFYLQVLAGLFEDAVAYLYTFSYVDAVHFAIALAHYGLLRAADAGTASNDLRSHTTRGLPQVNFGRMLGYYTRDFRAADVAAAVDYLALICLNADLPGEAGRRHAALCHEALRELVLESREFSKLIGDIRPDGRRIRGIIEERGPLIGLSEEDDFIATVTVQAATFAEDNGRTTDAVLLYHLAGEYDTVVAIVSRALSEAVALEIGEDPLKLMPVKPRAAGGSTDAAPNSSLSLASIDDPVELATTMMNMYERDAMFSRRIQDQNRVACRVLLQMSAIKGLLEGGHWAQCLDKIRGLEILPLDANGDPSTIRAYASKFSSLAQPVAINVPNLLMWTIVCCTQQRNQLTNGQFSGNEGTRRMVVDQMKQMTLDLTTYTSQLRYRFPPHLHEALARASAE